MPDKNNLAIDYDDSVDLIVEIEKCFIIKISDEEAATTITVGDLYNLVEAKLPKGHARKCMTSMAFYRLKQAISKINPNLKVLPRTRLEDISTLSPKSFFETIHRQSNLIMPPLANTAIGTIGVGIALISLFTLIIALINTSPLMIGLAITGIIISTLVLKFDPMKYPDKLTNQEDLAIITTKQNFGDLILEGARLDAYNLWEALVELVKSYSENPPSHISRETTLIAT